METELKVLGTIKYGQMKNAQKIYAFGYIFSCES